MHKWDFGDIAHSRSKNKDLARRAFILNVLLLGSMALSFIASVAAFINGLLGIVSKGAFVETFILFFIFLIAYHISRAGKSQLIAYLLIAIYLAITTYSSFHWGGDVPEDLLTYALLIVMSGILINSRFAFIISIVCFLLLVIIIQLQSNQFISIDSSWRSKPPILGDAIVYGVTFLIIATVSWLFNRETEKALKRAQNSERALQKQKERLEILVEERTQELQLAQIQKLTQMYRFVEFGRGASGLFHDLVNPLNIVSLNLDQLSERSKKFEQKEMKQLIHTAINNTKKLESFVIAARKQLQNQEELHLFSFKKEIVQVIQLLNYKIKNAHIRVLVTGEASLKTFNNPIQFNQLIMNLLSNAIDAYDGSTKNDKTIEIVLEKHNHDVVITMQDWASGIKKEYLSKIFDPLFTTKDFEKGTGIGLSICRNIVEKNFHGTIRVKSELHEGTVFTIKLPIQSPQLGKIKREKK